MTQPTTSRTALVVGCGIAGAACAIFLRRLGLAVTIVEAYPEPAGDEGGALMIAPNGMRVLDRLGVAAAVRGEGAVVRRMIFEDDAGGAPLARIAIGSPRLPPAVMVARAVLQRHLTHAARAAGADVRYGSRIVGLERGNASPLVGHFADGTELAADLVIGADGLHSAVRRLILGDGPGSGPHYTRLTSVGGFVPDLAQESRFADLHMMFAPSGFFAYAAVETIAPARVMWWTSLPFDFSDIERDDAEALRQRIADLCGQVPEPLAALMAASQRIIKVPLYELDPLPCWSLGRVGLIGDAAHAMPPHAGQGASMALEDALVVAHCLKIAPDPEQAFRLFHQSRRMRIAALQKQSRRNGASKKAPPGGGRLQRLAMRLFAPLATAAQNRIFDYRLPNLD